MRELHLLGEDLCERVSEMIQITRGLGDICFVNRAWRHTLGYAPGELEGLGCLGVVHPDSREEFAAAVRGLVPGGSALRFEGFLIARDGRRIGVEGRLGCRFDEGNQTLVWFIFRDLSQVEQLSRLFDLSLDLLCVAGTDGYFKQINPAFERVLGYQREELLSRSFLEFVHPDDREETLVEIERLSRGLPVVDFENRYQARDGNYCWLAWRSMPSADHKLIYAVARDITEQKRIERLLVKQTEDLARSNEELEQFAYMASHDLKAPLRAIGHLVDWIEEDLPERLPDEPRSHLGRLREQIARMELLTEDLLNYSRASQESKVVEEVDTAQLIEEIVSLLSPPPGLQVKTGQDLPVFQTVRTPLEQVFRNLVVNAIEHHDKTEGQVEVSARRRERFFKFSVSDDGPGIPDEYRSSIFNMFQTLPSAASRQGTGLGLALVKKIVERYGGRVWVAASQGRGTTFVFTWPVDIGSE